VQRRTIVALKEDVYGRYVDIACGYKETPLNRKFIFIAFIKVTFFKTVFLITIIIINSLSKRLNSFFSKLCSLDFVGCPYTTPTILCGRSGCNVSTKRSSRMVAVRKA